MKRQYAYIFFCVLVQLFSCYFVFGATDTSLDKVNIIHANTNTGYNDSITNTPLNFEAYQIAAIYSAFAPVDFSLSGIRLTADTCSLMHDVEFSASILQINETEVLDNLMINVTGGCYAYRLLPHGVHFSQPARIELAYEPLALPRGFQPDDIYTYYYNEELHQWQRMERVMVDTIHHVIVSLSTHFTDFINAVIRTPEMPEMNASLSTQMLESELPHPFEHLVLIEEPEVNTYGSAQISYPITIPAGRNGLQPDISLSYNSSNGNGLLGLGWAIPQSAITIDTRWGVPRYDTGYETEIYTLNGMQCVLKDGNPNLKLPYQSNVRINRQSGEVNFIVRDTKNCDRIIRHGNSPKNYWWEVIDRRGTISYYGKYADDDGVNSNCVLVDANGNIGYWALSEVVDLSGNYIKYEYAVDTDSEIYPKFIYYTGHRSANGDIDIKPTYRIHFHYDTRADVLQNGRLGFIRQTDSILCYIDITYLDGYKYYSEIYPLNRRFLFHYNDSSTVSLLSKIQDCTNTSDARLPIDGDCDLQKRTDVFYRGTTYFDYHIASLDSIFSGADVVIPIPDIRYNSLNASESRSWSVGGTATVGLGAGVWNTNLSVGGNYNYSKSNGKTEQMLLDMNGDGLTDWVYVEGNQMYYCPQQYINNVISFGNGINIGIPAKGLSRETSTTNTWGLQAGVDVGVSANVSGGQSYTNSYTSSYFSDINNDGLPDYIDNGKVYFNSLNASTNFIEFAGNPEIVIDSTQCSSNFYYDGRVEILPDCIVKDTIVSQYTFYRPDCSLDYCGTDPDTLENLMHDYIDCEECGEAIREYINSGLCPIELHSAFMNTYGLRSSASPDTASATLPDVDQRTLEEIVQGCLQFCDAELPCPECVDLYNIPELKEQYDECKRIHHCRTLCGECVHYLFNEDEYGYLQCADRYCLNGTLYSASTPCTDCEDICVDDIKHCRECITGNPRCMVCQECYQECLNSPEECAQCKINNNCLGAISEVCWSDCVASGGDMFACGDCMMSNGLYCEECRDTCEQYPDLCRMCVNRHCHYDETEVFINECWHDALSEYDSWVNNIKKKYSNVQIVKEDNVYYAHQIDTICPENTDPEIEAVRVWVAPKTGDVTLRSTMQLIQDTSISRVQARRVDGVRCLIQHNKNVVVNTDTHVLHSEATSIVDVYDIAANDYQQQNHTYSDISVNEGDVFFFHLRSHRTHSFDNVNWEQTFTYDDGSYYSSTDDFICSSDNVFKWDNNGTITLNADVVCQSNATAQLRILVNDEVVDSFQVNSSTSKCRKELSYSSGEIISLELSSPDNSNLGKIEVKPHIVFTTTSDTNVLTLTQWLAPRAVFPREIVLDSTYYQLFGPLYRGWGQFGYNNISAEDVIPIHSLSNSAIVYSQTASSDSATFCQSITFSENDTLAIMQDGVLENEFSSRNLYNPLDNAWIQMTPDVSQYRWEAYGMVARNGRTLLSNTRDQKNMVSMLGTENTFDENDIDDIDDMDYDSDVPVMPAGQRVTTIRKNSRTTQWNVNAGFGVCVLGTGQTYSESSYKIVADFMDMNGDGYPDIVRDSKIQYSQPWGGLGDIKEVGAKSYSNYSISRGQSFSGNYAYAEKLSGSNIRDGKFVTHSTGSIGAGGTSTSSNATTTYLDINGDGLSDKIEKINNQIYFSPNVGYGFASRKLLSLTEIDKNISSTSNGSIGGSTMWEGIATRIQEKFSSKHPGFLNKFQMSLALGMDINHSTNTLVNRLIDINGDGILEVVKQTGENLSISFISPQLSKKQTGINNHTIQSSSTLSFGVNAGITAGLTVWFVKLCFGVNGSPIGQSTTQTTHDLIDMNGDGLPDLVWVSDDKKLHIRYNQTGKNHLLKQITNSTGQILQIDYELSEPTREQRGRQWLMSSVSNIDPYAHPVLGCDTMIKTFTYANPHYDYAERQFLGYGTAITHDIQTDTIPHLSYRKIVRHYNNQDFMEHGKMVYEGLLDAEDNLYREYEINTWYVDSAFNQTDDLCDDASIRVGTEVHYTRYYEGEDRIVTAKKYDYDRYHNVKEYINLGDSVLPKDNLRATIEYDSTDIDAYNLVSLPSKVIIYNAEVACRELQAEYQRGLITEVRKIDLQGSHKDTTNYHYDTYGLLDSIIFPSNSKGERAFVVFAYDTFSYTLPAVMTDHWGRETQRTYDKLLQVPRTHIDPSGNTWKYTYDHFGRTTKIIAPMDATKSKNTITYEYILSDTNYSYTKFKYSDFERCTYYDSRGNILWKKKKGINPITREEAWIYSGINGFDCFGRTIYSYRNYIDQNYADNNGLTIDSLYLQNTFTWDIQDRPVRIAWSNNLQKTYDYSIGEDAAGVRRLKQIYTDEQGHSTLQFSAPQGWVTTSVLPTGNTTQFEYDAFGQLLTSIDPEGLSTIYQYDGLGRKISRFHPDAGVTQWSYDHAGNIITSATQKQLNNGNYTTYEYDYNRLKRIHHPIYSQLDVTYEYDSVGRISKRTDITGYESFQYDIWGNVSETNRLIVLPSEDNAYAFRTCYQYDALGRIQEVVYPDGERLGYFYAYDQLSYICGYNKEVKQFSRGIQKLYFDAYGKPLLYRYGNRCTTEYTYDPMRLWLTKQKICSDNHLLQEQQYSYDAIGNITQIEQIADSVGWLGGEYILDYQYDSLYRLIRADMSSHYFGNYTNYNMTYSPSGLVGEKTCNATPWNYQYGYKYNSSGHLQNHQLQCVYDNITGENTALQWDADGQLLNVLRPCRGDMRHHWWDEQGRLTAFVDNEHCGYYGYDGNGERVYKLTGQALLDQYNAGEPTFQMYFRDAVLYVNPYMVVTPRGYTKHYYNGNQRIAAQIGELEDLPDDIIVNSDTVAVERINNVREYMASLLNTVEMQEVDTTGIITDIAGNTIVGDSCDYSPLFSTSVYYDSNILYPILSKDSTELDIVNGTYFYHSDHLGSATWITNSVGTPVEYIHYMPYGELWVDQQATGYSERFKFTGKERDSETGYDYFGARYYSSTFPMWLSVDPLSDKYPHISPYAYCSWNPVKYVDPDGKIIKFAAGTTNAQQNQFWQAVRYLDQHNCGGRYRQLKNSSQVYTINMNAEKSQFVGSNRDMPTINWNPNKGIETDNGIIMSPATVLNHEMTHATHFDDAKKLLDKGNIDAWNAYVETTKKGTSEAYNKKEEERVITGNEQRTALLLGEIETGQVTRTNNKGSYVVVESPISNKKIEE